MYTCFNVTQDGNIKDLGWNRYETEQECFDYDINEGFNFEIIIMPIYVPLEDRYGLLKK